MICYEWMASVWGSDYATQRASPLKRQDIRYMPAYCCSVCGETRLTFINQYFRGKSPPLMGKPGPLELRDKEWMSLANQVRLTSDLPADYKIFPGAAIGMPVYVQTEVKVHDVMFPWRELVVTRRFLDLLSESGITGFTALPTGLR